MSGGSERGLVIIHEALRNIPRILRFYWCLSDALREILAMNGIIYLVGLVVVVIFILSFLGLR